jgi:demethylspheroidene O-methyltransferase
MLLRARARIARWQSSSRLQRLATAFLLTRPIARQRAARLFALSAGFTGSQILVACVRLRLLERLLEKPLTAASLATRLELPVETLQRLLDAAVALDIVACHGEHYLPGTLGAALLGNPGAVAMILHHDALYADLADPAGLVAAAPADRTSALARYWPYAGAGRPIALREPEIAAYSTLMSQSQAFIADQVLAAYPLARHRMLLDIGGGEGVFAIAAARRHPHLQVRVFDLPAVADRAAARIDQAGLAARAAAIGGSFLADPLPVGADVATLVRVLHDHDAPSVRGLLGRVRAALPQEGTLVVAEPLAGTDAWVDSYFACYFLAMGQGRLRTPGELTALLREAGFPRVTRLRTRLPLLTGVLVADAG